MTYRALTPLRLNPLNPATRSESGDDHFHQPLRRATPCPCGPRSHTVVPGAGHNLPQEVPQRFADAVMALVTRR